MTGQVQGLDDPTGGEEAFNRSPTGSTLSKSVQEPERWLVLDGHGEPMLPPERHQLLVPAPNFL